MKHVIYVGDVETTGIDDSIHDIIELSLWRSSDDSQKTWLIKATNIETIQDKALSVNKHKREDIIHNTKYGRETYMDPSEVIIDIENWILEDDVAIEDRAFVGQNPMFDIGFMKEFWKRQNSIDTFPFGPFIIDTLLLTRLIDLATGKKRKYYNLGKLVKAFGIPKGKAHKASEDVRMTKDLFFKQLNPLINIMKENFSDCYLE
jgi:DNA polymerase III alpha subunit (gram-positive type)